MCCQIIGICIVHDNGVIHLKTLHRYMIFRLKSPLLLCNRAVPQPQLPGFNLKCTVPMRQMKCSIFMLQKKIMCAKKTKNFEVRNFSFRFWKCVAETEMKRALESKKSLVAFRHSKFILVIDVKLFQSKNLVQSPK